MNKSILFSSLLVLSAYCITWAEGLDCYQCVYTDSEMLEGFIEDGLFDKSCKSGKKPNKKFLEECGSGQVCGKAYLDATVGNANVELTARGCVYKMEEFHDKCTEMDVESIKKLEDLDPAIRGLLGYVSDDSAATICTCDSDKCNSSSMLKVSHGLWLLSLAFIATCRRHM